jgi:GH24 family phage-related lysozyme (muramidase)
MAHEGFRSHSKELPDGRWVIGYGHLKAARQGLKITQPEAEAILREFDLPPVEKALNELLLVPVSQSEFDALVSFAFNIGLDQFDSSDVLAHMNAGNKIKAGWAMESWRKARVGARDMVVDPLVRRRADEKALFLKTEGPVPLASSSRFRPLVDVEETERYRKKASRNGFQTLGRPANDQNDSESTTETAARHVKERLTRILGEDHEQADADAVIETDRETSIEDDEKSINDIRKAVSALAVDDPKDEAGETAGSEDTDLQPADVEPRVAGDTAAFPFIGADNDAGGDIEQDPAEEDASQPSAIDTLIPPIDQIKPEEAFDPQDVKETQEARDEKTVEAIAAGDAVKAGDRLEGHTAEGEKLTVAEAMAAYGGTEAAGDNKDDSVYEADYGLESDDFAIGTEELEVIEEDGGDERDRVKFDHLRPLDRRLSDNRRDESYAGEGPLETFIFGLLSLIGAGLFAFGGSREFGWFGVERTDQTDISAYLPPFLMLLGGIVFVVMAYYCIKALFSRGRT